MQYLELMDKQNKKYHYIGGQVFGMIKFVSNEKMNAEQLDDAFHAVMNTAGTDNRQVIQDTFQDADIEYTLVKDNQWQDYKPNT